MQACLCSVCVCVCVYVYVVYVYMCVCVRACVSPFYCQVSYTQNATIIQGSMMSIVYKENVKITPAALEDLIVASGHDLRQVGLSTISLHKTVKPHPLPGVAQFVIMECWQQSHHRRTRR